MTAWMLVAAAVTTAVKHCSDDPGGGGQDIGLRGVCRGRSLNRSRFMTMIYVRLWDPLSTCIYSYDLDF